MMATSWKDFRQTLNLTPEEEEIINLEKSVINFGADVEENPIDWAGDLIRMVKEDTGEKLRMEDFPRMEFGRGS